jgi:hypothetical protein
MYKRIITYLEGDHRFNPKNSKKNIDSSLVLHHYNCALNILKDYANKIESINNINKAKSSYIINEEDITKSYIEIFTTQQHYFDTYEEHYSVKFEYEKDDDDMMDKTKQLIDFLRNTCEQNNATISITRRGFDDSLNNLPKNMPTYPIHILLTKTMKRVFDNSTHYLTTSIYTITLYKMEDTMCICLEDYFGKRIPLIKDKVVSPNVTWYDKYPSKHTNYIFCQENLEKIMKILTNKNSRLIKDELVF